MNKNFIVKYLRGVIGHRDEKRDLLMAIEGAKAEMEIANSIFENVEDPLLIEVAIYAEQAARKRYAYLVDQAKKNGVKANKKYIINKNLRLAE